MGTKLNIVYTRITHTIHLRENIRVKLSWNSVLLYICVVLLPTSAISTYFVISEINEKQEILANEAEQTAINYKNQLDRLIGETEAGIEMLAKVIKTKAVNHKEIQVILEESNKDDPRFAGYYFANSYGEIILGSSPIRKSTNILHYDYIQKAIITGETKISSRKNNYLGSGELISVVTPINNEDYELNGLLVVNMRIDYIQNIMRVLTPEQEIRVIDRNNNVLFETKQISSSDELSYLDMSLERAPWTIKVKIEKYSNNWLFKTLLFYIFISLALTNATFLLIKYLLLKRNAEFERMQNESQKLELVGQLAASTAHEIRNPLTGVKGLIKLLNEKYNDEQDQFYFRVIDQEINRINEIISEFLVLGKPTAETHSVHDINQIMKELEPLIQSEANLYNVNLILDVKTDSIFISCAKDHIKQVILNLSKNALESMRNGGYLTITISSLDKYCNISIKDTGEGIPKDLLEKIFDPFFTLKDTGTGLGLVVCKRIVNMYQGEITISSKINVGTEVHVMFPMHDK
jgi:two-component system, sporulation sensor kinase D